MGKNPAMRTTLSCALSLLLVAAASAEGSRPSHSPARAPHLAPRWYPRVPAGRARRAERSWEPLLRTPPRGTMPPRPGTTSPWRGARDGPRAPAEAAFEHSSVIVQGRVLPDPPSSPPAVARLDASRDGGGELLKPPAARDGRALSERPLVDRNGRTLAPGPSSTALIGRPEIAGRIADVQARWRDRRDHALTWRRWGDVDVAHRFDERGFHWWGFYAGGRYFWTRWHDGRYWWFDPYWRRWNFLYGGWWWWPSPSGAVYLYDGTVYENCQVAGGGVLMTPDETLPVVAPPPPAEEPDGLPPPEPPGEPGADAPRFADYSADGARSVEIIGVGGSAYLYDLTAPVSSGTPRTPQWLADGVKESRFVYEDKLPSSGSPAPVKQIELAYEGSSSYAVVDPSGERKVLVSGDDREASLYDLHDPKSAPVLLTRGATDVSLVITRDRGRPRLRMIIVSSDDETRGAAASLFTRDGAPVADAAPKADPVAVPPPPAGAPPPPAPHGG